jgi:hypothetical protein
LNGRRKKLKFKKTLFMKKILLIAVLAALAFIPKPKSVQLKAQPEKSCGAILFFNNTSGASVSKVVVDWQNTAYTDQTFFNPTFPFDTGTRCCGGGVTVIIYFTSGSGLIQASTASGLLACETFEAPHLSPIVFSTSCDDYYVNITSGTECP